MMSPPVRFPLLERFEIAAFDLQLDSLAQLATLVDGLGVPDLLYQLDS